MRRRLGLWFVLAFLCVVTVTPVALAAEYYTVQTGDSLWKIARLYHTSVDKLMAWNNLKTDRLQVGKKLKVEESLKPVSRSSSAEVNRSTPSSVYVVRQGDSLWSIARRFGMTVKELQAVNGLSSDRLQVGTRLKVRAGASSATSGKVSPTRPPASAPSRALDSNLALARDIINTGMQYLGTRYRSGGASPAGFDCSGFVMHVFSKHSISLPHSSRSQAGLGTSVQRSDLQPGDLVFFTTGGSTRINHVGIYTGDGKFIHSSSNRGIVITGMGETYYANCYVGARRILP